MKKALMMLAMMLGAGSALAETVLPEGYTAVECIIVPNGAYIDTGYKPNQNTCVAMDVTVQGATEYWFGCWDEGYNKGAFALGNDGDLGVYFAIGDNGGSYKRESTGGGVLPGRTTVEIDNWVSKFGGAKSVDWWNNRANFQLKNNLYLFAQNRKGSVYVPSEQSKIVCHGCTISEGGTLKRNFVPCVRMADAVAGLYDTVEQKFYGNAGQGSFGISESVLPFGRELTSGAYEITESFLFTAPSGESALKVAEGATVTLDIHSGVTVTLRGGDASGTTGAGAGIEVPANAKLVITGLGTLNATGGKGADGANGEKGTTPASYNESTQNSTAASGGKGGNGGGGAGAGIGGRGGNGGAGGAGGAELTDKWDKYEQSGNPGAAGSAGDDGASCGAVEICGTVNVVAIGGAAGANGSGGDKQEWCPNKGSTYYWAAYGSGGGGGGGGGSSASDIGGGGAGGGGAGGGGGGGLSYTKKSAYYIISYKKNGLGGTGGHGEGSSVGGKGKDRAGESTTYDGSTYPADKLDEGSGYSGGAGGAAGAAGAKGANGSVVVKDSAIAIAEESGYSVGRISDTEYIFWKQGKLYRVKDGVNTELAYSVVTKGTDSLDSNKWYVVKGVVSRGVIQVHGTANLVLLHSSSLTADSGGISSSLDYIAGIEVLRGDSLCVFGVESGSLTAIGSSDAAGIGGTRRLYVMSGSETFECGSVSIFGGTVRAQGGQNGAGIGGGSKGAGGKVTITGGRVTANGGWDGAGIGGGYEGAGGTVTINGGTVRAQGGANSENIGHGGFSGESGTLTVASRVFEVGNGHYCSGVVVSFERPLFLKVASATADAGPVKTTVNGREFICAVYPGNQLTLNFALDDIGVRMVGNETVQVGPVERDVRLDAAALPHAEEVLVDSVEYALPDGTCATATNVHPVHRNEDWSAMSAGWYVVTQSISRKALRTQGVGVVNLILANGTTLDVDGGIRVGGNGIVIYAQPPADGQAVEPGRLFASGKDDDHGIGGSSSKVTINGGIVTATGINGAGIGGSTLVDVTINGGVVSAQSDKGAGIGGGYGYDGWYVTINGGTVTASSECGAGIGGGLNSDGEKVKAVGTVNLGERVEIVEGSIALGSHYVKIVEKKPVGPTCEGGEIEWSDAANAWVITPNAGVTAVTVEGLPEGETVAVPPTVTQVNGVDDGQIRVYDGEEDITAQYLIHGGVISPFETFGDGRHYIESSNGAYIDTEYHPTGNARIVADFNPLEKQNWGSFFGVTETDDSPDGILMRYYNNDDKLNGWFCNADYREAQIGGVANRRIQAELKAGEMTVDGTNATITTTGTPYDGSIFLFSVNCKKKGGPYRTHAMRLYSFRIYDTVDGVEKLVRDLVQFLTTDGTEIAGLYDRVTQKCFINKGEGTLTLGCDEGTGPTCEGGTIEWSDAANAWVIMPSAGVTEVTIGGLPEGAKLAVKCGGCAVPSAAFVGFGEGKTEGVFSLALDENGVVTIGGEEIPVKPTIGDLDEGEPFTVGKGAVMVAARAIPGLRYTLVRGETVEAPAAPRLAAPSGGSAGGYENGGSTEEGGGTVIESVVATGTRVALTDANPPAGKAFYIISVSCPAAVVPSDSTIRIVGGRVYSGQYDITDAVTIREDGTVELKAGGVVGGVKVTPVIGDLPPSSDGVDNAELPLFLDGKDVVSLQTIPGLCYGLLRGETPDKVDEVVDWHRAESGTMTLRDFNSPKDGAFYRIVVKIEEF